MANATDVVMWISGTPSEGVLVAIPPIPPHVLTFFTTCVVHSFVFSYNE